MASFDKKADREISTHIVEVEVERFLYRLVRAPEVVYPADRFQAVEDQLDDLSECNNEGDMCPTLVRLPLGLRITSCCVYPALIVCSI